MKKVILYITVLTVFLSLSCSSIIKGLTDSLYEQKDVVLIEEGAPSYLILIEGLLRSNPNSKQYLLPAIQIFIAYGSSFVNDPDRKKIFADKTKDWAFRLLRSYPKFSKYEKTTDREQKEKELNEFLKSLSKKDVPEIFWATNAWINWILNNLDSTDAFMELPIAKALIERIYQLDDTYYYGAPHLYLGVFYGAFPKEIGGNLDKAKEEFDKALAISDKLLLTKIFYAEYYLKPKNDKKSYEKMMNDIIKFDVDKFPEMRLVNIVSQKQAKELLAKINDSFYE
jgi:hypothetical protein